MRKRPQITVGELIDHLSKCDRSLPVYCAASIHAIRGSGEITFRGETQTGSYAVDVRIPTHIDREEEMWRLIIQDV